jgi:hypothetical protein
MLILTITKQTTNMKQLVHVILSGRADSIFLTSILLLTRKIIIMSVQKNQLGKLHLFSYLDIDLDDYYGG